MLYDKKMNILSAKLAKNADYTALFSALSFKLYWKCFFRKIVKFLENYAHHDELCQK